MEIQILVQNQYRYHQGLILGTSTGFPQEFPNCIVLLFVFAITMHANSTRVYIYICRFRMKNSRSYISLNEAKNWFKHILGILQPMLGSNLYSRKKLCQYLYCYFVRIKQELSKLFICLFIYIGFK